MVMFMVDLLRTLLRMEDHAALAMLFWGNVSLSALVLYYVTAAGAANMGSNGSFLRRFALARIAQAIAWALLLFYKDCRTYSLLVIGCFIAIAGLFAESDALLYISSLRKGHKRVIRIGAISAGALGSLSFAASQCTGVSGISRGFSFLSLITLGVSCILGPISLAQPGSSAIRKLVGLSALAMYVSAIGWTLGGSEPFPLGILQDSIVRDAFRIALVILTLSGGTGVLILAKEEADLKIVELAIRDPLTELYNRRHFLERGRSEFTDCFRNGEEVAFLFLDLDGFKKINDRWGHQFGDTVLRDFAALLRLGIRPLDLPCRYGGEEFVIFLPRTGREGVLSVAERILEAVRTSKFPDRLDFRYTASAGIAFGKPETSDESCFMEFLAKSDAALYRAKKEGRDRVAFWEACVETEN